MDVIKPTKIVNKNKYNIIKQRLSPTILENKIIFNKN